MEYSSLALQEVEECEGGCKVKITVGTERDQREDSVFPGKGPEGGFRRDGKEMLGINHQEIEQY